MTNDRPKKWWQFDENWEGTVRILWLVGGMAAIRGLEKRGFSWYQAIGIVAAGMVALALVLTLVAGVIIVVRGAAGMLVEEGLVGVGRRVYAICLRPVLFGRSKVD